VTVLLALALVRCTGDSNRAGSSARPDHTRAAPAQDEWFTEAAEATGLDFVHFNGASGQFYYPEILPPGVALFDYDNDGDLDVYVVQGQMLGPEKDPRTALVRPHDARPLTGRLFRNDLQVRADGTRVLHFTDVTEQSGIKATQYGLGVAAADVDNDGWVDLLLTNFGTNQLLHNNGDGTFTDVSKSSGIQGEPGVAVSAAFLDYDRDGWLDLYVGYNVDYALKNDRKCPNNAGARDYCPPQIYGVRPDRLYRNLGHGTFVDVSAKALVGGKFGPARLASPVAATSEGKTRKNETSKDCRTIRVFIWASLQVMVALAQIWLGPRKGISGCRASRGPRGFPREIEIQ